MSISKSLLVGLLFATALQAFGQKHLVVLPVGKGIMIQSAINNRYNNNGYWNCLNSHNISLTLSSGEDNSLNCRFILQKSQEDGYYELYTENDNHTRLTFQEQEDSISSLMFLHICEGLYKIYNRSGALICLDSNSQIITCADNNGTESYWYMMDADTYEPLICENDTIKEERPKRKQSEFYAQIRANYYQYGAKVPLFFERLTFLDLRCREFGEIVLALNDCTSIMDQAERTILVLRGTSKNADKFVRKYIYNEIEKVNFRRPNILSKATIERYFVEQVPETDPELIALVESIKKKMLTGLSLRIR
ncbi:hypothetical protein CYCD_20990 [Tenuifilaceae bacterium CYCD]|nr:hypothetical protein CYCD_20990 [Tenuifilaceae bacterium CYCD]